MERYDNIVKIEEIRKLTDDGQYQKAVKILDTMDLHRIKSLTDLSILADVLTENGRFDEAMELLGRIYEKSKTRRVLYQMVELSIKQGDADQAEDYLLKYQKAAPNDSYRFIFRYYIDKLKGEPAEVLIESLEQLKEYEYIEVWAYELAKLYHKAGLRDKCVRECSDIILWFGDGIYVEKAMLLKAYYVGEIDPIHILKAKDKKETRERLGLDKTKDYSSIREQINEYLAGEETGENSSEAEETEEYRGVEENSKTEANSEDDLAAKREEAAPESKKSGTIGSKNTVSEGTNYKNAEAESMDSESTDFKTDFKNTDIKNTDFNSTDSEYRESKITDTESIEPESIESESTESESIEPVNTYYENTYSESIEPAEPEGINPAYTQAEGTNPEDAKAVSTYSETPEPDGLERNTVYEEEAYGEKGLEESIFTLFERASFDYPKELGGFLQSDEVKKQFQYCLENILSDSANSKFLSITGDKENGKTSFALKICKGLYYLKWIKTDRIAKITGENLNRVDILKQKDRLYGSTLIIENPGMLQADAAQRLYTFFKEMDDNIFVMIEGTREEISGFLEGNPLFKEYFTYEISLAPYTINQLVFFAKQYLENNNYMLKDEVKGEFIKALTEAAAVEDGRGAYGKAMRLAVKAKKAADARYKSLLGDILNSGKLKEDDLLYIIKEDIITEEI
ncbi:tetratricopeptide repeat protein [Anaerocolumna jejuensis]|uniref:tetratricopeptide repeat protein n=1 Tax=Anaerocolumna jejuensis TaxID=259063 RepID=UPI003F7CBC32